MRKNRLQILAKETANHSFDRLLKCGYFPYMLSPRIYWQKLTKLQRLANVAAALGVIYLLISFGQLLSQNASRPKPVSVAAFSGGEYTIYFMRESGRIENGVDYGETWTVKSDGSGLTKYSSKREENLPDVSRGIGESMGSWYGDFDSPDGSRRLVIDKGRFPFGEPTISVIVNGQQRRLLTTNTSIIRWLPDNRRVVFWDTRGGNGILDTESGQYGYVANGWPVIAVSQ